MDISLGVAASKLPTVSVTPYFASSQCAATARETRAFPCRAPTYFKYAISLLSLLAHSLYPLQPCPSGVSRDFSILCKQVFLARKLNNSFSPVNS